MKRLFAVLMIVSVMSLVLTGCSGDAAGGGETKTDAAAKPEGETK